MAGLFTKLGGTSFPVSAMSYTVAKHACVAITRAIGADSTLELSEGIKCYALCPYFADTQLVRDRWETDIKEFEAKIKNRVLTVEEVKL